MTSGEEAAGTKSVHWRGSAASPLDWETLIAIFDALFGTERRDLPSFPKSLDTVDAEWLDGNGVERSVDHVEDLIQPYAEHLTARISFGGRIANGVRAHFRYWPGGPRPRVDAAATAAPDAVEAILDPIREAFPLPYDGALIFLSWGGTSSESVARSLRGVLQRRFPTAEVFQSSVSIEPGDDPMRRVLEDGLLRAHVVFAVLTRDSVKRPWVIWETAVAWARQVLVLPVFVDVKPSSVPGPLTHKVQGVHLADRAAIDRALVKTATWLGMPEPEPLNDLEHEALKTANSI